MPSAAFDTSSLFSTEHGSVEWASDDAVRITLDGREWTFAVKEVQQLHADIEPLAAQVYRCNCDCRWQVRIEGHSTFVLNTDEVLQLHSLLDGAVAMLELHTLLDEAAIARSTGA